jgi:hypothetical protein
LESLVAYLVGEEVVVKDFISAVHLKEMASFPGHLDVFS